jgi:hypothetical protein
MQILDHHYNRLLFGQGNQFSLHDGEEVRPEYFSLERF